MTSVQEAGGANEGYSASQPEQKPATYLKDVSGGWVQDASGSYRITVEVFGADDDRDELLATFADLKRRVRAIRVRVPQAGGSS